MLRSAPFLSLLGISLFLCSVDSAQAQSKFSLDKSNSEYEEVGGTWYNYSSGSQGDPAVPERIIVRLQGGAPFSSYDLRGIGGQGLTQEAGALPGDYYVVVVDTTQRDPFVVAAYFDSDSSVDFVAFDGLGLLTGDFIPGDPLWDTGGPNGDGQWNLRTIRMPEAWGISTGAPSEIVAVLDSRASIMHPDLVDNLWTNPDEVDNGIDDDGNGYVDDFHGWDFGCNGSGTGCSGDNDPGLDPSVVPADAGIYHGTATAGIALARTDNGVGLAGVAGGNGQPGSGSLYMPVALHLYTGGGGSIPEGVTASSAARGIEYATQSGATVISMSFSFFSGAAYPELATAVGEAEAAGLVLVASAGNILRDNGNVLCNEKDVYTHYPAAYASVLSVGATTRAGERWICSSIGTNTNGSGNEQEFVLDVMAPGGRVSNENVDSTAVRSLLTTDAEGTFGRNPQPGVAGNYLDGLANIEYLFGGTSASAPHVAGLAALIRSVNPSLSPVQVRDLIRETADPAGCDPFPIPSGSSDPPVPQSTSYEKLCGHGRIDAYEALKRTLELYGGTLAQDLVIPSGETWDLGAVTLAFNTGMRLLVEGSLNASGTTFTEAEAGQGWGGMRFESGSDGTIAESVIEDVQGANSVYVYNADVLFEDTQIRDGSGTGLRASGSQATVTFRDGSNPNIEPQIRDHNAGGVVASSSAEVHVENSLILNTGARGVFAYTYGDLTLFETDVTVSNGFGASADLLGEVTFGDPNLTRSSVNNVVENHTSGTFFGMDGGVHFAGTACADPYSHNNFLRQSGTSELHADLTGSDVVAEYNYWGSSAGPSSSYVQLSDGAAFDGTPFLSTPGAGCGSTTSFTGTESGEALLGSASRAGAESAGGDDAASGPPEGMDPLRWEAFRSAHDGNRAVAFGRLVSAVQTAATPEDAWRAYEVLAQLGSRGETPPSVGAFLTARAGMEAERPWALGALSALRSRQGRSAEAVAAATALTVEYGGTEHALRGWAARHRYALEAGDEEAASAALGALEAGWPEHRMTALVQAEHALHYGEGAGARGTVPAARVSAETASEAEVSGPGAFGLGSAYPNPSRARVTVPLTLDAAAEVRVAVYDVLGREVAVLVDEALEPGAHEVTLDAAALPSGVYLVRLVAGDAVATRRITVLR